MIAQMYADTVPTAAIAAAVVAAAKAWNTEAVTYHPTAYDGEEEAAVIVHEIIGKASGGWNIYGREAVAVVNVATLAVNLTEETP